MKRIFATVLALIVTILQPALAEAGSMQAAALELNRLNP
jgi:hypothetical protein